MIVLVLAIGYPLLVLWQLNGRKLRDRLDVVVVFAVGFLFLLFARTTVDWQAVPPWLWLIGLLLLATSVVRAGWAWPDLQWTNSRRGGRRATSAAIQLVIATALIVVLL
ncbi:hypothetical protein F1D05_24430 [Kribbella qitaiheensis]|uniref:Uncharacterized protein n=1 Tax=Kribbella qitaiheensis TaxID=1544730 RepID=A0A7G6XA60_9ACTN|nr:hypothetical protein F1D05_24430 [Kribbella qitaiheensis]